MAEQNMENYNNENANVDFDGNSIDDKSSKLKLIVGVGAAGIATVVGGVALAKKAFGKHKDDKKEEEKEKKSKKKTKKKLHIGFVEVEPKEETKETTETEEKEEKEE